MAEQPTTKQRLSWEWEVKAGRKVVIPRQRLTEEALMWKLLDLAETGQFVSTIRRFDSTIRLERE